MEPPRSRPRPKGAARTNTTSKGKGKGAAKGKGGKGQRGKGAKGKAQADGVRRPRGPPSWQRVWNSLVGRPPSFRLASYNILAQCNLDAHASMYGRACRLGYAGWDWRGQNLEAELVAWHADVVCLQEVEEPALAQLAQRSGLTKAAWCARSTADHTKLDGCAILYSELTWRLISSEAMPLDVQGRNGCAVLVALEHHTGFLLIVATAHLLFNPKRADVRLQQAQMLLTRAREMQRAAGADRVGLVLCGDLNSTPDSGVYQCMRGLDTGAGVAMEDSMKEQPFEPSGHCGAGTSLAGCDTLASRRWVLEQELAAQVQAVVGSQGEGGQVLVLEGLSSCYAERCGGLPDGCVGEPAFTTYLERGTKGCVDYVFHCDELETVGRLEMLSPEVCAPWGWFNCERC